MTGRPIGASAWPSVPLTGPLATSAASTGAAHIASPELRARGSSVERGRAGAAATPAPRRSGPTPTVARGEGRPIARSRGPRPQSAPEPAEVAEHWQGASDGGKELVWRIAPRGRLPRRGSRAPGGGPLAARPRAVAGREPRRSRIPPSGARLVAGVDPLDLAARPLEAVSVLEAADEHVGLTTTTVSEPTCSSAAPSTASTMSPRERPGARWMRPSRSTHRSATRGLGRGAELEGDRARMARAARPGAVACRRATPPARWATRCSRRSVRAAWHAGIAGRRATRELLARRAPSPRPYGRPR